MLAAEAPDSLTGEEDANASDRRDDWIEETLRRRDAAFSDMFSDNGVPPGAGWEVLLKAASRIIFPASLTSDGAESSSWTFSTLNW